MRARVWSESVAVLCMDVLDCETTPFGGLTFGGTS